MRQTDDPSGIATCAQIGAIFGHSQLWLVWFTLPFMTLIQQMCGWIGLVTGKGLAGVILEHYSRPVMYFTVARLVAANTITIGAMAASAELIASQPFVFWLVVMTVSVTALEVFVPYRLSFRAS